MVKKLCGKCAEVYRGAFRIAEAPGHPPGVHRTEEDELSRGRVYCDGCGKKHWCVRYIVDLPGRKGAAP